MNDEDYRPTNREKRLAPKRGKFWCSGCDAQLVVEWQKCPNCGNRNSRRRNKK